MNINLIETTKHYPYISRGELKQQLGKSLGTIDNRIKEIEDQVKAGRYPEYSVIRDGGIVLVNCLVWTDYLTNRQMLLDSNARKYVEGYQPRKIANALGWC